MSTQTRRHPRLLLRLAVALLVGAGLLLGLLYGAAPLDADALAGARPVPSTLILDRHGEQLYEIMDAHSGAHRAIPLEEMPLDLRQAVIATEDATFYRNPGFSPLAILRALWTNAREGEIVSGASTITQQVARRMLLPEERYEQSLSRKIREAWLAFRLTRSLSKDEILALYLNESYFGNLAYGVEAAARAYFAKPAAELNLAEAAMLAGLLQAPEAYNPLTHPEAAKERQATVLTLMARAGYITPEAADLAAREPLRYGSQDLGIRAPHFTMLVREELERLLGAELVAQGGLTVHTTLDWGLQREAELQVQQHLAKLNQPTSETPSHRVRNAAVVALAPDGAVHVMVGSPDYFDASIDGAVNAALALRQPGSALKPFTYAAAFECGLSPATVLSDVRTTFRTAEGEPYVPINYDHIFHGPVSLREALGSSYNVVAVRVLDRIGPQALADMAQRVGITTLSHPQRQGLALTLGGAEVSLFELTAAYATLAQQGQLVQPYLIQEVRDAQGGLLYAHTPPAPQQALDPRIAYLVTDILADPQARIPSFGYGSALELPFPAAVKTGTTNNWRDNWTLGYTTKWTVGVWVGNANGAPMERATGVTGAAPIWNAVMRQLHRSWLPPFAEPEGLAHVEVCAGSGQLPGPACSHRRQELFLPENVPTEICEMHRLVEMDALTGALATAETPEERRIMRGVTYWPPDALAWAVDQGLPLPPEAVVAPHEASAGDHGTEVENVGLYLASPDDGASYRLSRELPLEHQQLQIAAVCAPCVAGDELRLWVDDTLFHVWTAPPYRTLWPLAEGEHVFTVTRHTHSGEQAENTSVEITVLADTLSSSRGESP